MGKAIIKVFEERNKIGMMKKCQIGIAHPDDDKIKKVLEYAIPEIKNAVLFCSRYLSIK